MQGSREVIAATIFVPVAGGPVVDAYMRNMNGSVIKNPVRIADGHWEAFVPQDLDPLTTSITARSQTAPAGAARVVSVVMTRNTPTPGTTQLDIYVRDLLGALQADSSSVEVTLARLPL